MIEEASEEAEQTKIQKIKVDVPKSVQQDKKKGVKVSQIDRGSFISVDNLPTTGNKSVNPSAS